MTLAALDRALAPHGLANLGALHPDDGGTLALIGPAGPGFWPIFQAAPEAQDGAPSPLDRWSTRVLDAVAADLGAQALYPFSGPPWHPFPTWSLATGWCHSAPVGLLVHAVQGLWISYRGALRFAERLELPPPPPSPCDTCADQPCRSACPVDAFASGYDVPACQAYLDTGPGQTCLTQGCAVRAACPVSQSFGRDSAQSAFHMAAFHG